MIPRKTLFIGTKYFGLGHSSKKNTVSTFLSESIQHSHNFRRTKLEYFLKSTKMWWKKVKDWKKNCLMLEKRGSGVHKSVLFADSKVFFAFLLKLYPVYPGEIHSEITSTTANTIQRSKFQKFESFQISFWWFLKQQSDFNYTGAVRNYIKYLWSFLLISRFVQRVSTDIWRMF